MAVLPNWRAKAARLDADSRLFFPADTTHPTLERAVHRPRSTADRLAGPAGGVSAAPVIAQPATPLFVPLDLSSGTKTSLFDAVSRLDDPTFAPLVEAPRLRRPLPAQPRRDRCRRPAKMRGGRGRSRSSAWAARGWRRGGGERVSAFDGDASRRWVALARDPGGVLVAVGPLAQRQRADMICQALARRLRGAGASRGGPAARPGGGGRAAARAAARPDTVQDTGMSGVPTRTAQTPAFARGGWAGRRRLPRACAPSPGSGRRPDAAGPRRERGACARRPPRPLRARRRRAPTWHRRSSMPARASPAT